ncbi:MAG: F0F1 ATP synthase subunit alpha [Candidatus Omnitrophica bacterium]|nr:F0F1 ATP synthase subunit alpha [Candidatus Omnitrophota bacterium]MDD5610652.1 F0F1 ATP synthase subunit alpha [Candidatus Omnitrophota bacterium]
MDIRPEEITAIIKKEFENFRVRLKTESTGRVMQVGDAIARVYGLDDVMMGEIVEFKNDVYGIVLNLEEDSVGAVILGTENPDRDIKEGDLVKRTGKVMQVPVGKSLLGRVINIAGMPIDGKGAITKDKFRLLEAQAPSVVERQPVKESLETGIKAIDSMIPIGRGQRELMIGDRQTGKTAIVLDTIINQKNKGVYCVYVAIGQKVANIVSMVETLEKHGAMEYTTVVSASARASASAQYLAPYTGCAIAEEFMYSGKHALVIYDDLSKHAQAYRQISLLLRRPPGREAYPGDIFYLHSRLLERAAKLRDDLGGGSLTALPIIETQAGDITSYIPTNVISITDGQIYLENDLFYAGVRPAINVGLSVSRVGGKAQEKAMRQVAAQLRLDLAQYRELASFAQFGAELDKSTQAQLVRGARMVEILKQEQYDVLSLSKQVMIIYAGDKGYLDSLPLEAVGKFEEGFYKYIAAKHADIEEEINAKKEMSDELMQRLDMAISDFKKEFLLGHE